MKAKTINVQITKCPKAYESIRLGGEWSVDKGETEEDVIKKATEFLNEQYAKMIQPKVVEQPAEKVAEAQTETPAEEPEQEKVAKTSLVYGRDTKVIQDIVNAIEQRGVNLDTILKYYELDEQTMVVVKTAIDVRDKLK